MKKIIIFGNGQAPLESITYLKKKYSILVVVDTDDSGIDNWQKSLLKFCQDNKIQFLKPRNFKEKEFLYKLKKFSPDIILSIQCRKLLTKEIIDLVKGEIFNFHFADLPLNRGCYPGVWHILNGDEFAAVTLHKLTLGIDDGSIIDKVRKKILLEDTARSIYFWCVDSVCPLLKKNIEGLTNKKYRSANQDSTKASYYSRKSIVFDNLFVNWNKTGRDVVRFIQAFIFPPYQFPMTRYKGQEIKITVINRINFGVRKSLPGTVVSVSGSNIEVQAKDSLIEVSVNTDLPIQEGDILYL